MKPTVHSQQASKLCVLQPGCVTQCLPDGAISANQVRTMHQSKLNEVVKVHNSKTQRCPWAAILDMRTNKNGHWCTSLMMLCSTVAKARNLLTSQAKYVQQTVKGAHMSCVLKQSM